MEYLEPCRTPEFLRQHAGAALEQAGFTRVYNVLDGFEGELNDRHQRNSIGGWRFEGLPWEQG